MPTHGLMASTRLLWSDLKDARPQKLHAYGAVNPLAQTVLGPRIQRLIDLTLASESVTNGKRITPHMLQRSGENDVDI